MRPYTATLLAFSALLLVPVGQAQVGPAPVNLRTAGRYVILAKSAISTVPASAITGDVGISPAAATYITGFTLTDATGYATSPQVTGRVYAADMVSPTPANLTTAVSDMETAYTDAAGRPNPNFSELYSGNLGGRVLAPGLYKWTSTVSAPTSFSLVGGPNDVWIFQISGGLSMSAGVNVTLSGGAQARNIFWQVAGAITIGTDAHVEGVLLSKTAIHLMSRTSLSGRALAQTAVTLDMNTVTPPPAGSTTSSDAADRISRGITLDPNTPNPFTGTTRIGFVLPTPSVVRLAVYDLLGREVALLVSESLPAGAHMAEWDANAMPSGVYVYRLTANGQVQTGRMTHLR